MKNKSFNSILIVLILAIIILLTLLYFNSPKKNDVTFTINKGKMTLKVGNTSKIDYSISDLNINIMWNSKNPSIASVDSNGNVTAKNEGITVITGKIDDEGQEKNISCVITVKAANYDILLEDVIIPEGEILLNTSDTYLIPITYIPDNAYIENIDYYIDNENIAKVDNGNLIALSKGRTTLRIIVNNINKEMIVNVTNKPVSTHIISPVKSFSFKQSEETIFVNETKDLKYVIEPSNGYVYDYKWECDNENIATVDDNGVVKGIKNGNTTISLTINERLTESINITVKSKIESIQLKYNPKELLKIGDSFKLHPTISPSNVQNQKIVYESSNPSTLSVTQDGTITARSQGKATITMKSEDNTVRKTISFTIVNNKGLIKSTQYIWAFSKSTDVTPRRCDAAFFQELAKKGKGTFSNNVYTYQKYSYNISNSVLTINGSGKIYVRIYYPPNKDLSTLNTFTFIGGKGEKDFHSYFDKIDTTRRDIMKSSGIIILIPPEESSIKTTSANVIEATNFVKAIINQNQYARNAVGGYSAGGPTAGEAARSKKYNKLMLINTSIDYGFKDLANVEVVVYKANNDSYRGTNGMIRDLSQNGNKNITIISNDSTYTNDYYTSRALVINPGSAMENGHTSNNIEKSHFFSYGCD